MKCLVSKLCLLLSLASVGLLSACGGDSGGAEEPDGSAGGSRDGGVLGMDGSVAAAGPFLRRASRSSTIDISADDRWVVMANREDDSVSIFDTTRANMRTALVPLGADAEPATVVIHPDGKSAFVALRGLASVVKISGIDTASPTVSAPARVGSEPVGIVLSPSGRRLFVAEYAEGNVAVLDTSSLAQIGLIEAPDHPYALAVTNNLDGNEDDEFLIAPEFFGVPVPGTEAKDNSRTGLVRIFSLKDYAPGESVTLAPIDSGFPRPTPEQPSPTTVLASPNQLNNVAVVGNRIYLTSVSASPVGAPNFSTNVQPVVYVADLAARKEVRDPLGTTNLAKLVAERIPAGSRRLFLADLAGIAFVQSQELIGYTVSTGADAVQRVSFMAAGATATAIGSAINEQIDVLDQGERGCQNPTGIVTRHGDNDTLYVSCWVSRSLGVVDLKKQELAQRVVASTPASDSAEQKKIDLGLRFFFTGRGRWSSEGWSSCGSCHPGGLSDGITWGFGAGPRQTTSMDGTFSHFAGKPQKQRALNWTAIFDELHDFERNTRGVSGGLGAITTAAPGECGMLGKETRQMEDPDGVGRPVKELQETVGNCTVDFDDIEAWVKTIRPPRGLTRTDPASIARGRTLFEQGGCTYCHAGSGWTVSRRFFIPSSAVNAALKLAPLSVPAFIRNAHTTQIAPEPPIMAGGTPVPPNQIACVIRDVKTFGVFGDLAATNALEVKNSGALRAQGEGGYNVPALYGLALGAPYLHHGQAASLEQLLSSPAYQQHLRAGGANFLTNEATAPADRKALIDFLLSIDATTPEFAIPVNQAGASFDICPADSYGG